MTTLFILIWLFPLPATFPVSESAAFRIIHGERILGELTASKTTAGERDIYLNNTLVRTRIVRQIEVLYQTRVVYQGGVLQEADVTVTVNGNPYARTLTKKSGSGYQVFRDGKLKQTLSQPITHSSIMLLFGEPLGVRSCYSEEGGVFNAIEPGGGATYSKINSKGRRTTYYYENRNLQRIDIDAGIMEFEMIRKP